MSQNESPSTPGRNDHCRRCARTGFELFLVTYDTGYGHEVPATPMEGWIIQRWVCRDCRSQLRHLVELAVVGTDRVKEVVAPWWSKDAHGWPIERVTNRPAWVYWLRVVFQNLRKVTG